MGKILIMAAVLLMAACGPRSTILPKGIEAINQANAQNHAIANNIAADKPVQAVGIKNNSDTIAKIVHLGANDEAKALIQELAVNFQTTVDQLTLDWQNERNALQQQVSRNEENATAVAKELEDARWWLKLGGVAAAIAVAARIAIGLGLPLGSVGTRVAAFASGLGNLPQRINNLKTLSVGAEEGRKELERSEREIDTLLGGQVSEAVHKHTNGKFSSLAELWKAAAKAAAVDAGNLSGARVELQKLRDEMPTEETAKLKV